MSFKSGLIKMAIKCTPNFMVIWVANIILKGIAELKDFSFELEPRTAYVQVQLVGEVETIDVWMEDFAVVKNDGDYHLVIQKAESNRLWLSNILSRIAGKTWKIPEIPQIASHLELIAELFKPEIVVQEAPEQKFPELEAPKQEKQEELENSDPEK
ncbi:MAG: hypothetical protein M0R47_07035 [Methylobacter sp.]|jgi:hypothetical protein|uniref:hypothetical protein n=1 Tax=Methylobacter sp. TaxID=2051955 RepID=UPI0025E6FD27|nr:hypothetical protein [Methylobacter sp.]MCK9620274.1 hypothetical protein [Methylobacter sp.]